MSDEQNAKADAIEEAIAWSLVGIVNGSGDELWQGIGTGTLVRWRDRHLLLTADHVINDTDPADLRFFLRSDAPIVRTSRSELLALRGVPAETLRPFEQLDLGGIHRDTKLDLAVLEVDEGIQEKHQVRFAELEEKAASPPEGSTVVIVGFPHDTSRVNHQNERVIFTHVEWSDIQPPRTGLAEFDPSHHLLVDYDLAAVFPQAHPAGLSGSAVWHQPAQKGPLWRPIPTIAGVTLAYYEKSRLLKAAKRETVESFLVSAFA
jgi:hypothetical protein